MSPSQIDLDQGGTYRTWDRQYLGPSVGWVNLPGQNIIQITTGGTYVLGPDTSLVTVNTTGAVTIKLPSGIFPIVPAGAQPQLFGVIPVTIVDIGGNAQAHPITIQPASGAETIMGLNSITISVNYGSFTFNPSLTNLISGLVGPVPIGLSGGIRLQRLVTSSPIVVVAGDQIINCNISSGSPTCTLPLASSRSGSPLTFKDVGGQFAAHNLTITTTGGDLIDGVSSATLTNNRQAITFVPLNDGTSIGWAIE